MKNKTNKPTKATSKPRAPRRRGKNLNPFAARLSAHVTEEDEWISGPPNLTLSRMFLVVLLLHIVIVGGILAFEMLKGDSAIAEEEPAKPLTADPNALAGAPSGRTLVAGDSYRVRPGDTLSHIADKHQVRTADLSALNGLGRGDQIYPGQTLLIPTAIDEIPHRPDFGSGAVPASLTEKVNPGGPVPPETEEEASGPAIPAEVEGPVVPEPEITEPPVAPVTGRTHKVEDGETAYAISRKYGVTVDAILAANGITEPRFLRAGDTIRIPD